MPACCGTKIEYLSPFWKDPKAWWRACVNTFHCLVGCSIGDFGMLIFLQYYYPWMSFWIMMAMAMVSGICTSIALETVILKIREEFTWSQSLRTAFAMSIISMVVMELAANLTDYALTKGQIPQSDPWYWYSLLIAMLMGFLVPLPYNYYKIKKYGKSCH